MAAKHGDAKVNALVAAALVELDGRTAPNAPERPTPIVRAAVDALLGVAEPASSDA